LVGTAVAALGLRLSITTVDVWECRGVVVPAVRDADGGTFRVEGHRGGLRLRVPLLGALRFAAVAATAAACSPVLWARARWILALTPSHSPPASAVTLFVVSLALRGSAVLPALRVPGQRLALPRPHELPLKTLAFSGGASAAASWERCGAGGAALPLRVVLVAPRSLARAVLQPGAVARAKLVRLARWIGVAALLVRAQGLLPALRP